MRSLFPSAFDSTTKALNVSFNQRELSLFSNPTYELTYQFDNTTYDANIPLSLTHIPIDDIWTRVSIKIDDTTYEYDCRQDGRIYANNNTYSIFWLFLGEENDLYFGNRIMEYNMIDPIGLLGAVNQTYILRLEDKIIYRNNNPQLIGGQMSYEARLYDYESGNFTAEYVIDVTSGIVFEINGNVRIVLDSPTNYPISRHRLVMCIVWIVMLSVVPLLTIILRNEKIPHIFLNSVYLPVDWNFMVMCGLI